MKKFLSLVILTACCSQVFAQTPTPTSSPTGTATPSACQNLQACIDTAVPTVVSGCAASNTSCNTEGNTDKYAVSAGQLAQRAIALKKCKDKKNRFACNVCYQAAKLPLQVRFKVNIFKGLLANAVSLIEQERKATCLNVSRKN